MEIIKAIVLGAATTADGIGTVTNDPKIKAGTAVASRLLRLIVDVLGVAKVEDVEAALQKIVDDGTKPIASADLDAQVDDAVRGAGR